jgi:hypothetical protein
VNRLRKWKAFTTTLCGFPTLKPKQPLVALPAYYIHVTWSGTTFGSREASLAPHHGTLNSPTPTIMLSCYSNHSSLLPPDPQHRDIRCKNGLFNGRPPLPFLVTSLLLLLLPPKATTITSVAASFASTTYNQEVLFSPVIIARHNRAILHGWQTKPHQLPTPAKTDTGQTLSSAGKLVRSWSTLDQAPSLYNSACGPSRVKKSRGPCRPSTLFDNVVDDDVAAA